MNEKDFTKDLEVDRMWIAKNDSYPNGAMEIQWSGAVGFGEYTLILSEDGTKFQAISECMDSNEDKKFIKALLEKIIESIEVTG